jgi:hypothetical protein
MIVLKAMFVGMFLIMVILGWVVVIATEKVVEKFDETEPEVKVEPEVKEEPKPKPKRKAPAKKVKKD